MATVVDTTEATAERRDVANLAQVAYYVYIVQMGVVLCMVLCLLPLACSQYVRFDIDITISDPENPSHISKYSLENSIVHLASGCIDFFPKFSACSVE